MPPEGRLARGRTGYGRRLVPPNQSPQDLAKKKNVCQIHAYGHESRRERVVPFPNPGKTLMLTPLLTSALKREALADPLDFHAAGWMVAVAYSGHAWKRVACAKWC